MPWTHGCGERMRRDMDKRRYFYFYKRNKKLCILSFLAVALLASFLFSSFLVPYDPYEQHLEIARSAPSWSHWMGTDRYGRDLFSRVWMGGQVTVLGALSVVTLISITGIGIGLCAGWYGGWVNQVLMRSSDLFLAFPGLVLALALVGVSQGGLVSAIAALWVVGWPKYARLSRGLALSLRGESFIEASRLLGIPDWKIMANHMLPNMAGPILVTAVLDIGTVMMGLSGLSFLGIGIKPPTPEWGAMISEGRNFLQLCPWMVLAPGGAMCLTVILFNLLGDTLRDYYDPKEK